MEADLRTNIPAPDLEASDDCGDESTLAESEESGVTVDGSGCSLLDDAYTSPGHSTEWTNEKHSLYIDSLERSFVDQLQHSKNLCGGITHENVRGPYSVSELPTKKCVSSDEFKVLRGGCWQKINFKRKEGKSEDVAQSRILKSPRTHKSVWGSKSNSVQPVDLLQQKFKEFPVPRNSSFYNGLASTSMQQPVGSTAEFSDQNFVEEHEKYNYAPGCKRVKKNTAATSVNDQVVPVGEYHIASASFSGHASK